MELLCVAESRKMTMETSGVSARSCVTCPASGVLFVYHPSNIRDGSA